MSLVPGCERFDEYAKSTESRLPVKLAQAELNGTLLQFQIGQKLWKFPENDVGKRRNCSLRAMSPFLTEFSKDLYSRHVKTRACLGKG